MDEVKFCRKCKQVKSVARFGVNRRALGGRMAHCKLCEAARSTLRRRMQADQSFKATARRMSEARRKAREAAAERRVARKWLPYSPETNPPFDPWM